MWYILIYCPTSLSFSLWIGFIQFYVSSTSQNRYTTGQQNIHVKWIEVATCSGKIRNLRVYVEVFTLIKWFCLKVH
jgi:hypothetical protein